MEDGYEISERVLTKETEKFLRSIWGSNSPLAHVGEIAMDHNSPKEGTSLYCSVKYKEKIVALAGLKFIHDKTIELGSLAVHPDHRGKNLTKPLFEWRTKIIDDLKKQDYQIITYATLGSNVMNFIGSRMKDLGFENTYPLNVGVGVVPIAEQKVKESLLDQGQAHNFLGNFYTSTFAILSSNRKYYYENIPNFPMDKLVKLFPSRKAENDFQESDNIEFDIRPIRINIKIIKDTNSTNFEKYKTDLFNQIQVPMLERFSPIHKKLDNKFICTGFNINGDILYAVYSNLLKGDLEKTLKYLKKTNDKDFYEKWVSLLIAMNRK